jgi:hypothetical protein
VYDDLHQDFKKCQSISEFVLIYPEKSGAKSKIAECGQEKMKI